MPHSLCVFFHEAAHNLPCTYLCPALSHMAPAREVSKYSLYAKGSCAQLKTEHFFTTAKEEPKS